MKQVKIIGVPEHFNFPWQMAIDDGVFEERGIEVLWEDIPEGTGRMAQMLAKGETDLAIILTEGILKGISEGNPSKIVQTYVETPLQWGIHVAAGSAYKTLEELEGKKAAISRHGSGSHLMAFVNAQNQGWQTEALHFEVVHTLDGAVAALEKGQADYFMWEHFTTKPLVDNGTFRRLADCPTPWPCFVIAGNEAFLSKNPRLVQHILDVINSYTVEFKKIPSMDRSIANRYGQQLNDVQQWLSMTEWSQRQLSSEEVSHVLATLKGLGLITTLNPFSHYLF